MVVGTVWSAESLAAARALPPAGGPDLLELRVDHFTRRPGQLDALTAGAARRPFLVTVRHPAEGGADSALGTAERRRLYERFLPVASLVDVEARSLRALAGVLAQAKAGGVRVVVSFHDFHGMPTLGRLREMAAHAADAGADAFKVAAATERPGDLARLLDFLEKERRLPLAAMGMGRLGRVSRLVLAAAGSVLNYGYLGRRSQVPGQWPAGLLRERIDEIKAEGGRRKAEKNEE